MARTIELVQSDRGWTVIGDGRFAAHLSSDEALWTVAMLLSGDREHQRYMRTYEQEMAWYERFPKTNGAPLPPVALLEDLRTRGPAATIARRMGIVRRTFDEAGRVINRFVQLKGSQ